MAVKNDPPPWPSPAKALPAAATATPLPEPEPAEEDHERQQDDPLDDEAHPGRVVRDHPRESTHRPPTV